MRKKAFGLAAIYIAIALSIAVLSPASSAWTRGLRRGDHPCSPVQASLHSSWSGTLHTFTTGSNSRAPTVISGSDGTHVVWEEAGSLYHSHGDDTDWTEPVSIAVGDSHAMAIDGDGWPHLVWANETDGKFRIYHGKWNGADWGSSQTVFETSIGQSGAPDIAVSVSIGGSIHVVWADYYAGKSRIYYAKSEDGRTWFEGGWIPGASGSVPALAIGNDGTIHVAWQDAGELGNTQNDIFYCARPYDGDWPLFL